MKKTVLPAFTYSKSSILTLALLFFLCSISVAQTVRYVATTGLDTNPGTFASPYLTISKGIAAASTIVVDTIKVAAGTYTAAATTTVNKSIVITGTNGTILNRGSYATSAVVGFTVTFSNVTIRKIKVTNYNVGISNTVAVSNLTLDSVQLFENWGSGFYSTFGIDSLAITNSNVSYNGKSPSTAIAPFKRGIYLSTGATYGKIRFDKDTVDYNGLGGIEISSINTTTSIDGITITNDLVRNNDDGAQISLWLGTANPLKKAILISNNTIVLSDTARYGIEVRNPAGNGKTSGTGSVVVSNNNLSVVSHTGNTRDMAAIAVTRRKETGALATINDQPQGVVVSGNTISDFQNPKLGKAFGIVLGGIGHKVFGNIISNTEFSIQLQKGNTNFATNVATPDVPNQTNTAYFDRDNSKDACVEIGSNTITTSGTARLTTALATTTLTLPAKRTTNSTTGETFCTLQQAIDFQATVAGNTITADAGTYDEQVVISKGVILDGIDTTRIATFTGTATGALGIFTVNSKDITIKNFKFNTDLANVNSAIISAADASNLVITGNTFYSSLSGAYKGAYSTRNCIYITNSSSNITIQSNTINSLNGPLFRAGVGVDNSNGLLVGGDSVSAGNNFFSSVNHDVIIKSYNGTQTVKNNIFRGGGVEVSNSAGNGAFVVSNNTFDGTYCHTIPSAMVRIFTNSFLTRTINFSYNSFVNQKWSVSFENTRNVTLDHNDITAVYDSFRLISVNTKLRQTASPGTLENIDIKLTNNNLSAVPGLTRGNALEFLNFDQRPANNYVTGKYIIGDAGNENTFNANIPTFIEVSNLNGVNTLTQPFLDSFPEYQGTQYVSTTAYWTRDIFARYNKFYVNGALKLATSFSTDDYNKVYAQIFDRQDDVNIGAVVLMPTWSGATSTDWADSTNWSYKFSPAAGLDAVIYPQVNQPELFANAECDTIVLSNNMTVKTGIYSLTVHGNVRSNGTMDATIGSITLAGTTPQVLSGLMFVKNLTLNNSAGAIIAAGSGNTVTLRGIYNPLQGVLTTNDNLVLKSDSSGTASISSGSGNYIVGKVTVERYLSALKAWRFLSIPTNTAQTVNQTWQEGGTGNTSNPVAGYGIQITGAGGVAAGFDLYSATPSMKTYNSETNTWAGVANTTTTIIKATDGYMTFVRGDRTSNAFNSAPTQTVLRTKGDLYIGDLTPIVVGANKFAAIGNPYPSALDMRYITKSGLKEFFYLWDPELGGSKGLGGYQTFSFNGSDYEITPGMGSYGAIGSVNNYIQSGQAFFMQANGTNGSLIFKEDAKTGTTATSAAEAPQGRNGLSLAQLRTSLYGVNTDNSTYMIDGVLSNYGESYSNSVDDMDAIKLTNVSENLSIKTANTLLAVERRFNIVANDTTFLNLANEKVQKYRFEFKADQLDQQGISGFLEDNYLHTSTALNLSGSTLVDFNIVNLPGSYAANRFRIVFKPALILPLSFTSIKAYQKNKDIAVEWKVENESNLKQYNVEKSIDGNRYAITNTIAAKNSALSNYTWLDINSSEGYNYYRIRSTDVNGKTAYSTVVKVFIGNGKQAISIYPNPVTNGTINLELTDQPPGEYGIRLINKMGQVMISKQINHAEGSSTETIQLNKYVRGIYQVEVSKPDGGKTNINVLVLK